MNKLDKPTYSPSEVFKACTSKVRDKSLLQKLQLCTPLISDAHNLYEEKAKKGLLHEINEHSDIGGVTDKEMKKVYSSRMLSKTSAGRFFYDKIRKLPKYGKCPYCNQRLVASLDHFLPKGNYPIYSVVPINLIPSCNDCNKLKLDKKISKSEDVILHPYYDDVTATKWLNAEIHTKNKLLVTFFINSNGLLDKVLESRLKYQFNTLELNELYSLNAMSEIRDIEFSLKDSYEKMGKQGVAERLRGDAKSCSLINKNSWKAALYNSLSESDWFCSTWLENE